MNTITKIRWWLAVFIVGLVVSGATAFPLVGEVRLLSHTLHPFWWTVIDMSFGVFGVIPLHFVRRLIKRLESQGSTMPRVAQVHDRGTGTRHGVAGGGAG